MAPKINLGIILVGLILGCSFCLFIEATPHIKTSSTDNKLERTDNPVWNASSTSTEANIREEYSSTSKEQKITDHPAWPGPASSTIAGGKCSCGPNSYDCYFNRGYKVCKCYPGYNQTSNTTYATCEECNCGPNSISCKFNNNQKICTCRNGYSGSSGKCLTCDCGINAISCEPLNSVLKKCVCKKGYQPYSDMLNPFDTKCRECDCGRDSLSCNFKGSFKECVCKPGFKVIPGGFLKGDKGCGIDCYCGANSISCYIDSIGSKKCTCSSGYVPVSLGISGETCKRCDCGPYATSCYLSYYTGKRTCSCKSGYIPKSPLWNDDEECVRSGKLSIKTMSAWKIAACAIAVVFGVIILIAWYSIRRERWRRWFMVR